MHVADSRHQPDSAYAAARLLVTLLLVTLGGAGMYVVPVVLPVVQVDFGVARADASMPYSMLLVGFGLGGLLMGKLADRFGVMVPLLVGAACIGAGFVIASQAQTLLAFALAHGVLIGLLGSAAAFSPLMADTALWWARRRGVAVAICASGNYLGGTIWPPIVQRFVESHGWRETYLGLGIGCGLAMAALALFMRPRPPLAAAGAARPDHAQPSDRPFGLPLPVALGLLMVAGVACCVAMSMPQVHIVAYCGDLGYGVARGAEMLSIMMGFGIASRLISGAICDRIGGLRTLLLGSALQGVALLLFLPFQGLVSLYVISALFGLFQGGIVPAYAIIVREHFPAARAGALVGAVIMCTLFGMALGGWMSGRIFDATGSYRAAFLNGIGWNALNLTITFYLLRRTLPPIRYRRERSAAGGTPSPASRGVRG
jgi:MFS family permease